MNGSNDDNLQTSYSKSPYENLSANDKLNGETVMSQIQPSQLQMQAKDSMSKFQSGLDVNNNSGSSK
jgi:hypothetical protein